MRASKHLLTSLWLAPRNSRRACSRRGLAKNGGWTSSGLPRWTIMAGYAVTYDLQEMPWAQAADVAKMRASLKQVLAENELLKLRILDVKICNLRAAQLLTADHPAKNVNESASLPSFAPPSPYPSQSHSHVRQFRDN
ncbi:g7808 [Coccomyxa elongata]